MHFYFVAAMTDEPRFVEPIPNVTVALGRDASLPCIVENLGTYKVNYVFHLCQLNFPANASPRSYPGK